MAVILFTQGIDVSRILRKNHGNNKWLFLEINKCAKMRNWRCNRKHDFRRHDSKKYRGHSYPKNIASKNNLRFILLSSFVIRFMISLVLWKWYDANSQNMLSQQLNREIIQKGIYHVRSSMCSVVWHHIVSSNIKNFTLR